MCTCDYGPEFSETTYPVARKQHICCECGSVIDPGEKYQRIKGVWDGDFATFKTCEICKNIRFEAESEIEECIAFECLYETIGSDFEYAAL